MEQQAESPGLKKANIIALFLAMTFPVCMSFVEFILLPGENDHNAAMKVAFVAGKMIQFGFPIVLVWMTARHLIRIERPHSDGIWLGLGFGAFVSLGIFLLYFAVLRGTDVFGETPNKVNDILRQVNLDSRLGFLLFAAFISIPHSFLEEYYWRWFVFGWLSRYLPLSIAIVVSSLAFMAHHVIVLAVYLPGYFWLAAVPFSLCTAAGGGVWAWMYHRYKTLYPIWVSHLLVDLALMAVGYDLLARFWE